MGLVLMGRAMLSKSLIQFSVAGLGCVSALLFTWDQTMVKRQKLLEKAEEPEIKFPTSAGSSKKQENSRKNTYLCFIDYIKLLDCVDHSKLWKSLKEMGIPDHVTCLLKNLYAGQEATVRNGHGKTD